MSIDRYTKIVSEPVDKPFLFGVVVALVVMATLAFVLYVSARFL